MIWRLLGLIVGGALMVFAGGSSLHILLNAREYWDLVFVVVLIVGIVPTIAGATLMWWAFWRGGRDPSTGLNRHYGSPVVDVLRYVSAAMGVAIASCVPIRLALSQIFHWRVGGDIGIIALATVLAILIGGLVLLMATPMGR